MTLGFYAHSSVDLRPESIRRVSHVRSRGRNVNGCLINHLQMMSESPKVLEIGSGDGRRLAELAPFLKGGTLIELDLQHTQLSKARSFQSVRMHASATESIFQPESFDLIGAQSVLWSLPERSRTVRLWNSWLRRGGLLSLSNHDSTALFQLSSSFEPELVRRMSEWTARAITETGGDPFVGHSLVDLVQSEGMHVVDLEERVVTRHGIQPMHMLKADWRFIRQILPLLLELKVTNWEEIRKVRNAYFAWGRSKQFLRRRLMFEVVARKP